MIDAPIRILIAEYVPSLNKGELAILKGMLKSFEELGEVDVAIFSLYPKIDKERYPPSIKTVDVGHSLYLRSPLPSQSKIYLLLASYFAVLQHLLFILLYGILGKNALKIMDKPLWKSYCENDVFILCHDEVNCVNGVFLQFSPIYISMLAKTLRKPVVFYANGTTQSTSKIWIWRSSTRKLWRFLAKYILSIVDLVTVREEGTLLYFKEITGGKVPIYLTADPAFLLSIADKKRVKEIMLKEKIERDEGLLIGVTITREVLSEAFRNEVNPAIKYKKSVKEIARLLDRVIEKHNSTIIFIPHSVEPYRNRDDRIVAKDVYGMMLNKNRTREIRKEYSPEELKGFIGKLDLLINCRVHAAINALSMAVPSCVITRSSDKRAYQIIGKMLKQEKYIYNVENLNADKLFVLITDLLDRSGEIRRELPSIVNSVKEKALFNGRLLKALLNSRLK
ncbi:MAG: polysaccharide pyruvyl transferase family protein [Promethearchaeota archaeon]